MKLRLPLFRSFFAGEDNLDIPKNRGLVPQHIVITNLSDELKQTDAQLAYVQSLIAAGDTVAPQADVVEGLAAEDVKNKNGIWPGVFALLFLLIIIVLSLYAIKQWGRKRYEQ